MEGGDQSMSEVIDERVVEMRFDNKQFEAGTKQTMNTLGRLKEALKLPDSSKALENLDKAAKNVSLNGIEAGVEALSRRFSTFGIVGMRVIENVTDALMNKLNVAVKFVTDSIVSGGIKRAMNIENAHFQLQALLKDETKVQAVMADAMESVDGTAYAYDEAAKAASQFAASGIQAGEEMLGALKGITGVAAMTNSSFEDVSRIFTTVAGNGRLMGDQLLQLSSRGLNAASTLSDYFREVRGQSNMTEASIRDLVSKGKISFKDFSDAMTWAFGDSAKRANETFTGSLSNMKSALARIGAGFISPLVEQNGELVKLFNALRIKINDVKSSLVFDEQKSAISGLAKATGLTKNQFDGMFKMMKSSGKVSVDVIDLLAKRGANAEVALRKYINGVTNGSIRASYAITNLVSDITQGRQVSTASVRRFVEEGKIDLATFTSAMETEFGTERTISKKFTDWFLNHISTIVKAINSADLNKPMKIVNVGFSSLKNVANGLLSVLNPVAKAFSDVFLNVNSDEILTFAESLERLTSKMKLSEKGSKNLHDVMEGLFNVVKFGVDIFFQLFGAILPINKPVVEMSGGFLDLAGSIGRSLTKFTKTIRSCNGLNKAFSLLSSTFLSTMSSIAKLIKMFRNFGSAIYNLKGTRDLIASINNIFKNLSTRTTVYIDGFIDRIDGLSKSIFNIKGINVDNILNAISKAFSKLSFGLDHFSFKSIEGSFDALKEKIKALLDLAMSNKGFSSFVNNFKKFCEDLKEAFTLDNLLDRMERVMDVFGRFFNWIKDTIRPAFKDVSLGGLAATGGSLGLIYAIIQAAEAFKNISSTLKTGTNLIDAFTGALTAYQNKLKAESLISIAGAIAILSGSLVLLSFADPDRLIKASIALTLVAGTLGLGITKFMEAINKGKELDSVATTVAKGLKSAAKKIGRAIEIKALGSAIKDFAKSIAIIAASIVGLGIFWRKDPQAFNAALNTIWGISNVMVGIGALLVVGSKIGSSRKMTAISKSILLISASLLFVVASISTLFKMDLPLDYGKKLAILGGILLGLSGVAALLSLTARISGGNDLPKMAGAIKSLSILLITTVLSLKALFKMDLPLDYGKKLAILGGIFVGFGALILAIGAAAKISEGNGFKAGKTILAMAAFIAVVVGSLIVLSIIPWQKMLSGAVSFGIVLTALGVALYGAGKIGDSNTYKTILSMAITVGAISGSLAILSMIPWKKLIIGATSLGSVLFVLSISFEKLSKVKSKKALPSALAMIAALLSITYSLYTLSEQPWEGLIAAAGALSSTLIAFSKSFQIILSKTWSKNNVKKIETFLLLTLAVVPIGIALGALANQPWEGLIAGSIGLSAVLLALTACFAIASKIKVDLKSIAAIIAGSAALLLVSASISMLTKYDGSKLIASCLALSSMLLVMVGVMAACSVLSGVVGPAIVGVLGLGAVIAVIGAVLAALGGLAQIPGLKWIIGEGGDLLRLIGESIGQFLGGIVGGVMGGISSQLPQLGKDLSAFMTALQPFILGSKSIDALALASVGFLSGIIIALTSAEIVNGITNLFGLSLVDMAVELSNFMIALAPFISATNSLQEDSMKACGYLASMIVMLTGAELLGGIASFLGIGTSLSDFGKQLVEFGPYIKQFANMVKDVKPEAVQGAAAAAEIMGNMAKKLPGTGGLVQKIFGERSLADFGRELVSFGPSIRTFANMVKDVKPEAVQGAAAAAEIMSKMATNLPNQGGLAAKILGDNTLSTFGNELVKFGPRISIFAKQVAGINPEAVRGASTVTTIMTKLANDLPSTDSLWNSIFGGGKTTLSEFGTELVKFGQSMTSFSKSVEGMNNEQINGAISGFKGLVDLSTYVQNGSAAELVNFANKLGEIGTDSVTKFTNAFSGSGSKASEAVASLMSSIVKAINGKNSVLKTIGITSVNSWVSGFSLSYSKASSTGTILGNKVINALKALTSSFLSTGKMSASNYLTGIKNRYSEANYVGRSLANNALSGCSSVYSSFYVAGKNGGKGFVDGLNSMLSSSTAAGRALGLSAYRAAKKALDERSPSHKMAEVGDYAGLGFINKLMTYVAKASKTGEKIGKSTIDGLVSVISDTDNMNPVIRPTVDLDNVRSSVSEINKMFNDSIAYTSNLARSTSSSVSRIEHRKDAQNEVQSNKEGRRGNNYIFNQTNYSPRALSRIEIYRGTANQIYQFKEATDNR